MSHSSSLLPVLFLSGLALASACHEPVPLPDNPDSATDGDGYFPDPSTTGDVPPPPSPADFCTLNPDATDAWERFTCSGGMSVALVFEYHGDPDLPIHSYLPCVDLSDGQATEPSYVYTCFASMHEEPFGPNIANPYADDVDACCYADAPNDFVEDFCAIEAAEELCLGTVTALDDLRKQIPQVGAGAELYDQLTNLNKFIATNQAQTSCASELAQELLADEGTPDWSPDAEDPAEGWPWIRAIDLNIPWFDLDEPEPTGTFCGESFALEMVQCDVEGLVQVTGPLTTVSAPVSGRATLGTSPCADESCPIQLNGLEVDVADIQLGGWSLGEIHASLLNSAEGRVSGSAFNIPARKVQLEAGFRVAGDEAGELLGETVTVGLSADGELAGSIDDGGLRLGELVVTSWPLEIRMVELQGACK